MFKETDHQKVSEATIQQMTEIEHTSQSIEDWDLEKNLSTITDKREQTMSVPMNYLYLLIIDIKSTIDDLDQMEQKACEEHKWEEALIIRGMKNKLNLTREQQLLNVVGSKYGKQARLDGLKSISEKQDIISKRDKVLSNGNTFLKILFRFMFSEESKVLWNKWNAEDEDIENNTSFTEREHMIQSLEDEWKVLDVEDKERIGVLYAKTKPDFLKKHHH